MDTQEKFSTSKEVIAYLAQTFPNCFSLEGDAKPLKIGIFQDLAERLENDDRISKTLLRTSLRHYTNSWRYLYCVKEGACRVDLDGKQDAEIEKQHADHAQKQLQESKAKAAERRKEQNKNKPNSKKTFKKSAGSVNKPTINGTNSEKPRPNKRSAPPEKLSEDNLVAGTKVTVKFGKAPMLAVITEVAKDGVHVQLESGMVAKVQASQLRLARSKR